MHTYSLVASRNLIRAEREMLKHAEPIKVISNFGAQKQQPQRQTDTVTFRRPLPLDYSSTTYAPVVSANDYVLAEGATPAPRTIQYQDVSVTLQQYGILLQISSKAALMYEDDIPSDMIMLAGEHMATIEEMICYNVVRAGTTVYFPSGLARATVNVPISLNVLRKASRALEARHGKRVTQRLAPGPNFGTSSVHPSYLVFIHTDVESDVRNMPGFTSVVDYGSQKPVHEREIGAVENYRFITSPYFRPLANAATSAASLNGMVSTGGTYPDVYQSLVIAQDAWGQVALKGMGTAKPRYLPPTDINHANPMGQFGFVSASFWKAAVRLAEAWMVRIEHAATDLS